MSMEIKLRIKEGEKFEEKTFIRPIVSGRILRKTIEYDKKFAELVEAAGSNIENYDQLKDMELAAEYVSEAFGNQFTPDQYIDGIESHKLVPEFLRIRNLVRTGRDEAMGGTNKDGESDPNA